jgi:hypothetical protein
VKHVKMDNSLEQSKIILHAPSALPSFSRQKMVKNLEKGTYPNFYTHTHIRRERETCTHAQWHASSHKLNNAYSRSSGDIGPFMGKQIVVESLDRASDRQKVITDRKGNRKNDLTER